MSDSGTRETWKATEVAGARPGVPPAKAMRIPELTLIVNESWWLGLASEKAGVVIALPCWRALVVVGSDLCWTSALAGRVAIAAADGVQIRTR